MFILEVSHDLLLSIQSHKCIYFLYLIGKIKQIYTSMYEDKLIKIKRNPDDYIRVLFHLRGIYFTLLLNFTI